MCTGNIVCSASCDFCINLLVKIVKNIYDKSHNVQKHLKNS